MSYFQNIFTLDCIGSLVLGDRAHAVDFKCPLNAGRGDEIIVAWNPESYNLSGTDADGNSCANLTINYANNVDGFKNWAALTINVAAGAVSSSAVKISEIITNLQANATFAGFFTAVSEKGKDGVAHLMIKSKLGALRTKFYVSNGTAEEKLGFNKRAGVAELPSFFARHTIANRYTYADGQGLLIPLDMSLNVDKAIVNNAVDAKGVSLGLSSGTVQADWQLLRGRSGLFTFKKQTVDTSSRITQIIEYPAGARAGDLAKKTTMTYTGTQTAPDTFAEVPYTLQSSDLITP